MPLVMLYEVARVARVARLAAKGFPRREEDSAGRSL